MNRPPRRRYVGLLGDHLVGEVPGEQQDVVRHLGEQPLGRRDRDPHAGHVAALLLRAPVDDEVERLAADAEHVQQRAALRRGPVGGDALLRRAAARRAARRGRARAPRRGRRTRGRSRASPTPQRASSASSAVTAAAGGRHACVADADAQRAAVDRDALDVDEREPVAPDERVERREREVAEVLVVDRVELAAVEHVLHVRHLDHRDPVVGETAREAGDEAVEPGDVGEHVVRVEDVGARPLRGEPLRERRCRRTRRSWGCRAPRATARDVARRLDAEHRHAARAIDAEQVPVVDSRPRRRGSRGRDAARRRAPSASAVGVRAASCRRTTRSRRSRGTAPRAARSR